MGRYIRIEDSRQDFVKITVTGVVTADELKRELASYCRAPMSRLVLWDFRTADVSSLSAHEIGNFAHFVSHNYTGQTDGKVALVFSSEVDFGLGRMYDTQLEISFASVPRKSFKNIQHAHEWLGVSPE